MGSPAGDLHMLAVVAVCRNALVGTGTRRVTCTCWLLWLSVEMPWLVLGGPILALFAQIGLENTALTL